MQPKITPGFIPLMGVAAGLVCMLMLCINHQAGTLWISALILVLLIVFINVMSLYRGNLRQRQEIANLKQRIEGQTPRTGPTISNLKAEIILSQPGPGDAVSPV